MFRTWGNHLHNEVSGGEGGSGGGTPPVAAGEADPLFDGGQTPPAAPPSAPPEEGAPPPKATVTIPDNWKEALPEDLRGQAWLKNINSVEALAKSYQNAQKLVGADKIPVPTKNSTPEEWKNVFRKLGNPEKLEEYKLELPKEIEIEEEMLKGLTKVFHDNGILPNQARSLIEYIDKVDKEIIAKLDQQRKDAQAASVMGLKKEWGSTYEEQIAKAKAALIEFTSPEERKAFQDSGLGYDPLFIKFLNKVGDTLSEDKILGAGGSGNGVPTPLQARAEARDIMADKNSPYWNAEHPEHRQVKQKVETLFKIASSNT